MEDSEEDVAGIMAQTRCITWTQTSMLVAGQDGVVMMARFR